MAKERSLRYSDYEKTKPLTKEETRELIDLKERGDISARDILICRNMRLVTYIAKRYINAGADMDDLISIGTIGLIKGVDTYKSEKTTQLGSYVGICIENEIKMYLRRTKRYNKEVSLEEPISTDREGNRLMLQDIVANGDVEHYKIYENMQQVALVLGYILNILPYKEKVCTLYCLADWTQPEIAREMGISRSYVSRIIARARDKLSELLSVGKKIEEQWSVNILNNGYIISVRCNLDEEANEILRMAKEMEVVCTYNDQKINLFMTINELTLKFLADVCKYLKI